MLKSISANFLLLLLGLGYAFSRLVGTQAGPHHMEALSEVSTNSAQKEAAARSMQLEQMARILWIPLTIFWGFIAKKCYGHFFPRGARWTRGDLLFAVIFNLALGILWTCLSAISVKKLMHSAPVAPTKAVGQETQKAFKQTMRLQPPAKDCNADDAPADCLHTAPVESGNSTNTTIEKAEKATLEAVDQLISQP